jgi:hypothetical protein
MSRCYDYLDCLVTSWWVDKMLFSCICASRRLGTSFRWRSGLDIFSTAFPSLLTTLMCLHFSEHGQYGDDTGANPELLITMTKKRKRLWKILLDFWTCILEWAKGVLWHRPCFLLLGNQIWAQSRGFPLNV